MEGLLQSCSESKKIQPGEREGVQGGEVGMRESWRRKEPSLLPKARGHSSRYRFHCGLRRSGCQKETAKQKGRAAKPKRNRARG